MVYINSTGQIVAKKPWYQSIVEFFFGIINFFILFFKTLWDPTLTKHGSTASSDYRPDGKRRPDDDRGGPPRKRMGGFGGGGGSPNCPPMSGGG